MKKMILPNPDASILRLSGVTLGYSGSVVALSDISFTVHRGEFVGIIGPNGSGKSTLLKGILGLIPLVRGKIELFGTEVLSPKQARSRIGYVPQKNKNETQFPVAVKEVVLMGLYSRIGWFHRPKPHHWEQVMESLNLVGMEDYALRPFGALSGGQQQRVIIARALVSDAELLLFDEPTSAVDLPARSGILEILERLNRESGKTICMVTHDINEIVHFSHKVVLLNRELQAFGSPSEVLTRENLASVYGTRVFIYDHNGHPHILVGDFDL